MLRKFVRKLGVIRTGIFITLSSMLISVAIRTGIATIRGVEDNLFPHIVIAAVVPLIIAPVMSYIFIGLLSQIDKAEQENARLVNELQTALAATKTLEGLLPICATCKKIRDDAGYWHQVEAYIGDHAKVNFSHGICPDCVKDMREKMAAAKKLKGV